MSESLTINQLWEPKDPITYQTPSNTLNVYLRATLIDIKEVPTNIKAIKQLCGNCPNHGLKYSCPPHSPAFDEYSRDYENIFILGLYVYLKDIPPNPKVLSEIADFQKRWRTLDKSLSSRLGKALRALEGYFDGSALIEGACGLCNPCAGNEGKPCKKPDQRRYSLESTGVDVVTLSERFLNHKLAWLVYEKSGNNTGKVTDERYWFVFGQTMNQRPAYLTKIGGILTNTDQFEADTVMDFIKKGIRGF
jgi:predicted metal-binding protein